MINLVLTSLPLFFLSFFKIPEGVSKILRGLQRKFFWGGLEGREKISWVGWRKNCAPKSHGGLEVKDISLFNCALMTKWRYNLFQDRGTLWVRVLESKYLGWRGLRECENKFF